MSKVEILIDGKSELSGTLTEMNVSYQHPHRPGACHGASVSLSLMVPKEREEACSWFSDTPHDDVRGWRGPIGFGLVNLNQPAVCCCCCDKVIEPVNLKIDDREERSALRRKSLVARWFLPGGETGAASRYAHPKCLAKIRDLSPAFGLCCEPVRLHDKLGLKYPEGLNFVAQDLLDSPEKKDQEARVKGLIHGSFFLKEDAWRADVQYVQAREARKVEALLSKQPGRPLKPECGDQVVAYGSHWTIGALDKRSALLNDDTQQRHLSLPVEELVFVSRPGLLVVDPSCAKYHHSK